MDLFTCRHCGQRLYFENTRCERCGHRLGYLPDAATLAALEPLAAEPVPGAATAPQDWPAGAAAWSGREAAGPRDPPGAAWRPILPGPAAAAAWRFCENAAHDVCNWMVPVRSAERFCAACRHNRVIPDLGRDGNLMRWRKLEEAKHRLFYTLLRLRLPLADRRDDPGFGLGFDFLEDLPGQPPGSPRVMTGQDDGVITLNIAEADDAVREGLRQKMGEPYRTLLGHFRHESGHYFWDRLVRDGGHLDACRALFGDDRADYEAALRRHYAHGPPPDWQARTISAYATSHPWEDFAETWAHYLHIVDTLETARAFAMDLRPHEGAAQGDLDPYAARSIDDLVACWLPLVFAMNSLNRSMGQGDLYPFVLSPPVVGKLGFIHALVQPFAGQG